MASTDQSSHVVGEPQPQAYGWLLPVKLHTTAINSQLAQQQQQQQQQATTASTGGGDCGAVGVAEHQRPIGPTGLSVPVPVYCRPVSDRDNVMVSNLFITASLSSHRRLTVNLRTKTNLEMTFKVMLG